MKSSLLSLLSLFTVAACVSGFVGPVSRRSRTTLSVAILVDAPAAPSSIIAPVSKGEASISTTSLNDGIGRFIAQEPSSAITTSTNVLSLKERPPPPTAEELAAKKRTFNLWFWGGGFVAPFLATFYYFGFKFWER